MSYMIIIVDGVEYVGKGSDTVTVDDLASTAYAFVDDIQRIKIPLHDGRFLILPGAAVQRATFIAHPGLPSREGDSHE